MWPVVTTGAQAAAAAAAGLSSQQEFPAFPDELDVDLTTVFDGLEDFETIFAEPLLQPNAEEAFDTQQHAEPGAEREELREIQGLVEKIENQLSSESQSTGPMSSTLSQLRGTLSRLQQQIARSGHDQPPLQQRRNRAARASEAESAGPRTVGCKRTKERHRKFNQLEELLAEKRAQAAELERENVALRRQQKMLDAFIQVCGVPPVTVFLFFGS